MDPLGIYIKFITNSNRLIDLRDRLHVIDYQTDNKMVKAFAFQLLSYFQFLNELETKISILLAGDTFVHSSIVNLRSQLQS